MRKHFLLTFKVLLIIAVVNGTTLANDLPIFEQIRHMRIDSDLTRLENTIRYLHRLYLSNEYVPPANMKYIFLPAGTPEGIDTLRIRYSVADGTYSITQSRCIFYISISNERFSAESLQDKLACVQSVARRIFKNGSDITLIVSKEYEDNLEGTIEKREREDAIWLEGLLWWFNKGEISFAFLRKERRESSSVFRGYGIEFNKNWFDDRKSPYWK